MSVKSATLAHPGVARPAEEVGVAAERHESLVRRVFAAIIAVGFAASILGVAWDVQWHAAVGRDSFLIPSHLLLYSGVLIAGVLSLAMVLRSTRLYGRPGSGVTEANTVRVLGVFHAPLGFVVCGFGMLTMLIAAPFDNYWHELYGIDVTVWAAFHIMGILGAGIGGIGLLYAVASEANRQREAHGAPLGGPRPWTPLTVAVVGALAFALPAPMVTVLPAALQWPTTEIGALAFLTYPVLIALLVPVSMIAAVRFTGRAGAATLVGLLFTALRAMMMLFAPLLTTWLVGTLHETYRPYAPEFPLLPTTYPAWLIAGGLAVDLVYWLAARRGGAEAFRATAPALLAGVLGMAVVGVLDHPWWRVLALGHDAPYITMAVGLGAVVTLLATLFSAWLGKGLGAALRIVRQ